MSIELKTHKILWGKSGNKCAFPSCRKELVMDESETDDPSVIGEEAHIVGRKNDGPRGKSALTSEQRDKYENLILLCSVHHKLIDDQINTYTVEKLHEIKKAHEEWVNKNLSIDRLKERDDVIYAGYVDKIIELASANEWKTWTSYIFGSGQPHVYESYLKKLEKLIEYILARVWPFRYPELETAFHNLKAVINDFLKVFEEHLERPALIAGQNHTSTEDVMIWTKKFYRIDEWNPEKYNALAEKYEYHCFLVEDLALEMTRAMNHIFDLVRKYLFPGFRMEEGVLLIIIGPFMDFSWHTIRAEYTSEEKKDLYPGLRKFMEVREKRNYFRGRGVSEDYFNKF